MRKREKKEENTVTGFQKQRDRSGIEDGRVEIDGIGTSHKEIDHRGLPHSNPFTKSCRNSLSLGRCVESK